MITFASEVFVSLFLPRDATVQRDYNRPSARP